MRITDYCCRGQGAALGSEEASPSDEIVFVRRGAFVKHIGRDEVLADVNHVLFFGRDESYRVSHPVCTDDRCTIFTLRPELLREMVAAHDPETRAGDRRLFPARFARSGSQSHLLHRRLVESVSQGVSSVLEVEETVFALLDATLAKAYPPPRPERGPARGSTREAHRAAVDEARALLARRYGERLALDDVARAVSCSPYHLARLFRRETGVSLHRYLNRLRLRQALESMLDPGLDLTTVALAAGFADHSHFTNAFRREFGVTPSSARRRASARDLCEMSKNLQA